MRPKIGDIIEIATSKGLAYAIYSHEHAVAPRMGSLLRILSGFFSERPQGFSELVERGEQFAVFFPLGAAIRRDVVRIAGREALPDWAIPFPVFRNGLPDGDGVIRQWWLWDGIKEWRVDKLTSEMQKFPVLRTVNDTYLIEMIEKEYRAENDA